MSPRSRTVTKTEYGRYLGFIMSLSTALCVVAGHALAAPTFDSGTSLARFSPHNSELSGMAASRTNPGVWWSHADSGDGPDVYEQDFSGNYLGNSHLTSATATDWEDMAIGPGPVAGIDYIYIGDIGDNGANRNMGVQIYRFPEPVVYPRQAGSPVSRNIPNTTWQVTTVTYPGIIFFREQDAETLMVDPRNGDVYIAQKLNDHIPVFRASASSLFQGTTVSLTQVADISTPGWKATSGEIQPQAKELIIRGYGQYRLLWQIASGQTIQQALAGTSYVIPYRSESQGEAICYERNGSGYMTISEGSPIDLWYFARTSADGPTPIFTIIPPESQWRYLDNGSDQGTAWRNPGFNDSSWNSGLAQLGYGEGDEQTVVGYGGNPSNKYVTTYFRKTFCVDTSQSFETLYLRVLYEGGIAVYLNGTEILRNALASGASYNTLATGTRGATKYSWLTVTVNKSLLLNGENTIAVEEHLASASQGDLSFDFQLEGTRTYSVQTYPITLVTQSEPPGLTVPSFSMDGGATTIATGGDRSFWVVSSITNNTLPYTAYEATTNLYNLGADGDPACRCTDYANGGDSRCWPRVTVTNSRLYKGNATWPATNHFDWYDVYYPTGPVTITATYKAREIPVTYGPYVSGPAVVYHAVTGHSIVVTPAVRPGYNLTGVAATSGVTTDLGNGTWRLSDVTDFGGTTVTATYAINAYTLTYTAGANGSISGTTPQSVAPGSDGTPVTAVPDTGYHFMQWSDGLLTATRTDTNVSADISVIATFAINQYTLTYAAGPNGSIAGPTPQTVNHGSDGAAVTAVPDANHHFVQWSDGVLTATRIDTNVTGNISVTASFAIDQHTLTYLAGAHGSISGTTPQTVNHGTDGITVTAVPDPGYHFVQWSDGILTAARTETNVTANLSVTATFAPNTNTITYVAVPVAGGTLAGPASVLTGGTAALTASAYPGYTCVSVIVTNGSVAGAYPNFTLSNVTADTTVTATFTANSNPISYVANPFAGGTVSGPANVLTGGTAALTVTVNLGYNLSDVTASNGTVSGTFPNFMLSGVTAATTVTATFTTTPVWNLTYTVAPSAGGEISGPAAIYQTPGTTVTLTVTANPGYTLSTISANNGATITGSGPYTLGNVTADTTVTATFTPNSNVLTYAVTPIGAGTLTGPSNVLTGDTAALAVTTSVGYTYASITTTSGMVTGAYPDFTLSGVTAPATVTAHFTFNQYTLTYGAGANGSISGTTPQTVNHGDDGMPVTAVPNVGYHFVQWSDGILTATRTDANVTANINVTASFAINQYTLTYAAGANGSISGTTPQTVSHGASGTAVTAVSDPGYHFLQWSDGILTATRTDANVTANINVTANFAINQYTLTYVAGSNGYISGTTPQTVSHGADGTAVMAVANAGYYFVQWSDGVLTATRTDTNVTGNISVTASFARCKGTVIIQATPGSAPWSFLDGDGASHDGVGDAVIPDIPTGLIAVTWGPLHGFTAPQGENQVLASAGTVTFIGVYGPAVVFTTPPQDQRHYAGDTASFDIATTGGVGALHYQWFFDDGRTGPMPVGNDSPVLAFAGVVLADAGHYWCDVTDEYPATYSSPSAKLEVADHLQITQDPMGGDKRAGESHTFFVGANGGFGALSYTWQKDGETIPGADSASYTIPALTAGDAGIYAAVVSDEFADVIQSNTATLNVMAPSVPLSGVAGALALLAVFGLGGVFIIRGKQK